MVKLEGVAGEGGNFLQDCNGFGSNFRTDAITGYYENLQFHLFSLCPFKV